MSNYYQKQEGKVAIAHALMERGWKVYGYHADESDSMTDYWSPAYWNGIATKNGFVLCVDINNASEAEEIKRYNYSNTSYSDREKITKLEAMTQENGCTAGEEQNAKELIQKINNKENEEVKKYEVIGIIPAHMGNPGKCKWHIEKDGKIYDKGTGITKYADIPESYIFNINKMEYTERYKTEWTGTDENGCRIMTDRKLPEETRKIINDFKALILRFERVVNNMNGCGDGTEETEKAGIEAQQKIGYEKVTVKEAKTGLKMVETDNKEIKVGLYLSFKHHSGFWLVTDTGTRSGTWKINGVSTKLEKNTFSYEQVGAASRGYNRTKNGKRYYQWEDSLLKEIENGSCKIYELKEVTEEIEVEKWVKIDKSKNTYNTKKENKQEEKPEHTTTNTTSETTNIINHEIIITADTDTRDNSAIWVVKLVNRVDSEEFNRIRNEVMKPINGYYSRFKGGFIFKYDPTEVLKGNNTVTTEQPIQNEVQETTENAVKEKEQKIYSAEININSKINSIEISFINELDNEIKTDLKQHSFRYMELKNIWYALNTEKNIQYACTITGKEIEQYKEAV